MDSIRQDAQDAQDIQDSQSIPKLGFGTYRLKGDTVYNSTLQALKQGYTHIDTANLYRNETEIGKAIKDSRVCRNKLWLTTKIQVKDIRKGKEAILSSIMNSLKELDTEYLDLVLFHGPDEKIVESWKFLEEIFVELKNKIRFIGVSNYDISHLELLLGSCKIKPYANQFEVSPFWNRDELIQYCRNKGIIAVAHTSLVKGEKFNDQKLTQLSQKVKIIEPLLLLAWALHKGLIVLPRSAKVEHIQENMKCLTIQLDSEIMRTLDSFHEDYCTHPQYKPK